MSKTRSSDTAAFFTPDFGIHSPLIQLKALALLPNFLYLVALSRFIGFSELTLGLHLHSFQLLECYISGHHSWVKLDSLIGAVRREEEEG